MNLSTAHCIPCNAGTPALSNQEEDSYLGELVGWDVIRDDVHRIKKEYRFHSYLEGMTFVRHAAALSDSLGHHPEIHLLYKKVVIDIYTHAVKGLSVNDFILASRIDALKL